MIGNAARHSIRSTFRLSRSNVYRRFATMNESTSKSYLSHEERTADQPRDPNTHKVIVSQIALVNDSIRVLRLTPKALDRQVKFSPGQWLDVHIPGLTKAGGFTLTSTPADAEPNMGQKEEASMSQTVELKSEEEYQNVVHHPLIDSTQRPFLELAVQYSPRNPPAAWLWGSFDTVMGAELLVRVGGNFTWPPPSISDPSRTDRLVLIAGGVGINPLMSILTHLHRTKSLPRNTKLLYSTKIPEAWISNQRVNLPWSRIQFLPRIMSIAAATPTFETNVFLTGVGASAVHIPQSTSVKTYNNRISQDDLTKAIGEDVDARKKSLVYVCGPQRMTDETVAFLESLENMHGRVLCERWW